MSLALELEDGLSKVMETLKAAIGRNLYSCILYGSAARGDWAAGVSDVNLLLVLEESTPPAHAAIADALQSPLRISPLVIGLRGMQRTFRVFATKFLSIQRNYRLLQGTDVLSNLQIDSEQRRFLVEQAIRNYRLRDVYAFVAGRGNRPRYTQFLLRTRTGLITQISEALRLTGIEIPKDRNERIPVFSRQLAIDASVLQDLASLKQQRRVLRSDEASDYHERMVALLDGVLTWMERQWPNH